MIATHTQSKRFKFLMDLWARKIPDYGADIIWIGGVNNYSEPVRNIPAENLIKLPIWPNPDQRQIHQHNLVECTATGSKYFLEHTQYTWFFRALDDTWINLPKFPLFLQDLEKHDPINDIVLKHHCIYHPDEIPYPQGGAGFFWSRKTVETLYPFMSDWSRATEKSDDNTIPFIFDKGAITVSSGDSPYFIGEGFEPLPLGPKYQFSSLQLPKCPNITDKKWIDYHTKPDSKRPECPTFVRPLNQIVFYHAASYFPKAQRAWQFKALEYAPDEIKVFRNGCFSYLCRDDGVEAGLYSLPNRPPVV